RSRTACASKKASCLLDFSRWNTMRSAERCPTPGSLRNSSIRRCSGPDKRESLTVRSSWGPARKAAPPSLREACQYSDGAAIDLPDVQCMQPTEFCLDSLTTGSFNTTQGSWAAETKPIHRISIRCSYFCNLRGRRLRGSHVCRLHRHRTELKVGPSRG